MKKILLLAACLAAPTPAHAACEDFFPVWAKKLVPGRKFDAEHVACKPWPANPALTLAAMPFPTEESNEEGGSDDLLVLVADSKSGKVSAHLLQESAIQYDAVTLAEIALDTARYQLMPSRRAFGVRITHGGSSRVNPYSAKELSLYVIEGSALRPVVERLLVNSLGGETDGGCAGTLTEMSRVISLGAPGQDGYAALQLDEQAKDTVSTGHDNQCDDKVSPVRRASHTLNYSGGHYAVPKALAYE